MQMNDKTLNILVALFVMVAKTQAMNFHTGGHPRTWNTPPWMQGYQANPQGAQQYPINSSAYFMQQNPQTYSCQCSSCVSYSVGALSAPPYSAHAAGHNFQYAQAYYPMPSPYSVQQSFVQSSGRFHQAQSQGGSGVRQNAREQRMMAWNHMDLNDFFGLIDCLSWEHNSYREQFFKDYLEVLTLRLKNNFFENTRHVRINNYVRALDVVAIFIDKNYNLFSQLRSNLECYANLWIQKTCESSTSQVMPIIEECSNLQFAHVIWALSKLRIPIPERLFQAITPEKIINFSASDLSLILYSLARGENPFPGEFFDNLISALRPEIIAQMEPQDIGSTTWALVKMEKTIPEGLKNRILALPFHSLNRFNAQNLSNTIWAFAKAEGCIPDNLIRALIPNKIKDFKLHNIECTLWAFSIDKEKRIPGSFLSMLNLKPHQIHKMSLLSLSIIVRDLLLKSNPQEDFIKTLYFEAQKKAHFSILSQYKSILDAQNFLKSRNLL